MRRYRHRMQQSPDRQPRLTAPEAALPSFYLPLAGDQAASLIANGAIAGSFIVERLLIVSIFVGSAFISVAAEARGGGKFLGSLLGRAAIKGAAGAGSSSSNGIKTYGPDVLTVSQLAQCIRKAGKLDDDSTRLEGERAILQASSSSIDASRSQVSAARTVVDNRSQRSVDAFNVLVDRHNELVRKGKSDQLAFNIGVGRHNADVDAYNADCGKNYYSSDLDAAQALASAK